MRASVLLWSTLSGAIIGIIVDALLIGLALIVSTVLPPLRAPNRWVVSGAAVVLAAILFGLTVLGYFEGRLKAV